MQEQNAEEYMYVQVQKYKRKCRGSLVFIKRAGVAYTTV